MSATPPRPDQVPVPTIHQAPPEVLAGRTPDDGWQLADPQPMGPVTRRALRAVVDALCPRPPAPWSEAMAERIEHGVRVFLRYLPPVLGHGFGPMVVLLDWSPLWRLRSVRPLHQHDRPWAAAHLQLLSTSRFKPIRLMIMAARAAVLSVYYDQDEVHEALDYDPMPFLQGRADLRRRLMEGQAAGPEDHIGPYSEVTR
jgi:hypothetical protein